MTRLLPRGLRLPGKCGQRRGGSSASRPKAVRTPSPNPFVLRLLLVLLLLLLLSLLLNDPSTAHADHRARRFLQPRRTESAHSGPPPRNRQSGLASARFILPSRPTKLQLTGLGPGKAHRLSLPIRCPSLPFTAVLLPRLGPDDWGYDGLWLIAPDGGEPTLVANSPPEILFHSCVLDTDVDADDGDDHLIIILIMMMKKKMMLLPLLLPTPFSACNGAVSRCPPPPGRTTVFSTGGPAIGLVTEGAMAEIAVPLRPDAQTDCSLLPCGEGEHCFDRTQPTVDCQPLPAGTVAPGPGTFTGGDGAESETAAGFVAPAAGVWCSGVGRLSACRPVAGSCAEYRAAGQVRLC